MNLKERKGSMKENDFLRPEFVGILKPELVTRIENEDGSVTVIDNNPEIWATIKDFPLYEVSSKGFVRDENGKLLTRSKKPYDFRVNMKYLTPDGKIKRNDKYVGTLVYNAFFERPEGMENTRQFVITVIFPNFLSRLKRFF